MWIAAVSLAHRLPIVTQDHDFDALEDFPGIELIRVCLCGPARPQLTAYGGLQLAPG